MYFIINYFNEFITLTIFNAFTNIYNNYDLILFLICVAKFLCKIKCSNFSGSGVGDHSTPSKRPSVSTEFLKISQLISQYFILQILQ